MFEIPDAPIDQWMEELKPYQRSSVSEMLVNSDPEEVARTWLSARPEGIAPFGGEQNTQPFWDRFLSELHRFVCDEEAYVAEKEAFASEGVIAKGILISVISSAIASTLGLTAALLAPAVALLLYTIAKIGRNAYCAGEAVLSGHPVEDAESQ